MKNKNRTLFFSCLYQYQVRTSTIKSMELFQCKMNGCQCDRERIRDVHPFFFSGNNYIITLLQGGMQNITERHTNKQNVLELNFEGGAFYLLKITQRLSGEKRMGFDRVVTWEVRVGVHIYMKKLEMDLIWGGGKVLRLVWSIGGWNQFLLFLRIEVWWISEGLLNIWAEFMKFICWASQCTHGKMIPLFQSCLMRKERKMT